MDKIINKSNLSILVFFVVVSFSIFDFFLFSINKVGVDTGYFLSISRDWIILGKIPGIDTYSGYTTLGYILYAVPYLFDKCPPIEVFWMLNLSLFIVTTVIFFKSINSLIEQKTIVFLIVLSFVYNNHYITHDIKLENLVLFFNVLIFHLLILIKISYTKLNKEKRYFLITLIGFIAALAFLTKQYAGISILFSFLILIYFRIEKWYKLLFILLISFLTILFLYSITQFLYGLSPSVIIKQMLGGSMVSCSGSIYGERKCLNLVFAFKNYKFDVLIYALFLGFIRRLMISENKTKWVQGIFFFLFSLLLAQLPFYFQVFPHYKIFGITFLYLISILCIENFIFNPRFLNVVYIWIIFLILMSAYTFYSYGSGFNSLKLQKIENRNFVDKINQKLPRGTVAFMLNSHRVLWFEADFVSPLPKTLSYGFYGVDCLKLALNIEKPKEFWICRNKDDKINLANYEIIKEIKVTGKNEDLFAWQYHLKVNNSRK